jgi:type IV secretion system protein VirB5
VRWVERSYTEGTPRATERWTAIISIVLQPPRDVVRLRKNPLGVYVNGLDWSRELGGETEGANK